MLYPYARRVPPRPPCALDAWIGPGWRLLERHAIDVAAPPPAAVAALAGLRIRELPAVRALFALRGLGARPDATLLEFFSTAPFVLLDEGGAELVGGVLLPAREGEARARRVPRSPAEFQRALARAPFAAVATFRAETRAGGAHLWTETWARTRGPAAAATFAAYWLAVGPFSAWIRRMFLREARRRAEGGRPG